MSFFEFWNNDSFTPVGGKAVKVNKRTKHDSK